MQHTEVQLPVLGQGFVPTAQEDPRREAWLEDRRTAITGTDLPAILGISRWSSPIQVYLDKKGLAENRQNNAMSWGKRFERPILMAYAEAQGIDIDFADPYQLHRVPDFPLLGASLDGIRKDGNPVDAKNTRKKTPDWGEEGSDQIPVYYAAQLAVQMMACNAPFADLAVLFSGQDLFCYRVHRDLETEALMKEKAAAWWERHIVRDIPPDMDGSDSSSDYIRKRFARSTEVTRETTPEVLEWIRKRQEADAQIKAATAIKSEAENLLKAYMGEASVIPGVCTWKNNRDSEVIDWEGLAKDLAEGMDPAIYQQTLSTYTTTKPGARVLRINAR